MCVIVHFDSDCSLLPQVEMLETGSLLRHSTQNSLVVRGNEGQGRPVCAARLAAGLRRQIPPFQRTHLLPATCHLPSIWRQVLDELGRGTATHDGHAIAYAVALWLARERRCR